MYRHGFILLHSFIALIFTIDLTAAAPSPYQWQQRLGNTSPDDWKKYVRSPPSEIVHPARVLSQYTQGNVTNPDGLLTGKGSTILTRSAPQSNTTYAYAAGPPPPTIVVDWGQNIAGFLSISFGGSYNSTPGLPGIRLAFSETLQYLTDTSDFSRSYNVRPRPYFQSHFTKSQQGDSITPGSDQVSHFRGNIGTNSSFT
jgi:hypothetical protein